MQSTLKKTAILTGVGLHSGKPSQVRIQPTSAEYGIWFVRTDVTDRDNMIPALFDQVSDTSLNTRIANAAGTEVSTIEHLMAALSGTGIFNALIEIDGPEVPIMDGSSVPFVKAIMKAGVRKLDTPVRAIRILEDISVTIDDVVVSLTPSDHMEIDFAIDFNASAIGSQQKTLNMANGTFVRELSNCRTFCTRSDVEKLQSAGLGLGGSLDNAIVVDGADVLNPGGFRRQDECVRHKMLDALGDLALAGAPILGRYSGQRAGHKATNVLLRELFSRPDAWEMIVCDDDQANEVPGAHISANDLHLVA